MALLFSRSEVMTVLTAFHLSGQQCFKYFYLSTFQAAIIAVFLMHLAMHDL
ncbi:MAG: hypothetical protein ACLFUB_19575 [Cyclobacteriaceae bacterium]